MLISASCLIPVALGAFFLGAFAFHFLSCERSDYYWYEEYGEWVAGRPLLSWRWWSSLFNRGPW